MKFPGTIAFINPKSGGKHGTKLYLKLCVILGEDHVFDLSKGGPESGLRKFSKCENLKVIACGGDGTVGWLHSWIDKIKFASPPAVVPFPLGTGNDMSRVLGWGANYAGEAIIHRLEDIEGAVAIKMDRWMICSEPLEDEDINLLQSLLSQSHKSFSNDIPPSHQEPTPIRTFSAPPQPTQNRSSSSSSQTMVATTSTPPPNWISSKRLRFNSASEIPQRPRRKRLSVSSSSSSLSNSLEVVEMDPSIASNPASGSSTPPLPTSKGTEAEITPTENPNLHLPVTASSANGVSGLEDRDDRDDGNDYQTPKGTNQTSLALDVVAESAFDAGIECEVMIPELVILDTRALEMVQSKADTGSTVTLAETTAVEEVIDSSLLLLDEGSTQAHRRKKKNTKRPLAQSEDHIALESRRSGKKKRRNKAIVEDATTSLASSSEVTESAFESETLALPSSADSLAPVESPWTPPPACRLPDLRKIRSTSSLSSSSFNLAERRTLVMNNYFSLGVDSMVALEFHNKREASPTLFPHHVINKAWYGVYGLKHCLLNLSNKPELRRVMRLELDGVEVKIPKGVEAIVLLQIPSYSSGTDVWGDPKKAKGQRSPPTVSDGLFEVVGLKGVMHLGALQAGWSSGLRLGQASRAVLYNLCVIPVQCDGEPWLLPPYKTTVEFQNQSTMLFNIHLSQSNKRFRTVTGMPLPSMVDPTAAESNNNNDISSTQDSTTESSSSELNPAEIREDIREAAAPSIKSTHDIPPRVRAAGRAITRSHDSLPVMSALQQPERSAEQPLEMVVEIHASPTKKNKKRA